MDFEKIKNRWVSDSCKKTINFAGRQNRWILVFISLLLIVYCGYTWYRHIYNPGWNEARKREYFESKEKSNVFEKDRFDRVVAETERRKSEYQKKYEEQTDIFRIK